MITDIRTISQQLEKPQFAKPKELVAWMGAIQGQDYTMSKWAVGIRLKNGKLSEVEEALRSGEILRTHVMRPTWHLVTAEDIRWMLKLTGGRIKAAFDAYSAGYFKVEDDWYLRCRALLENMLEGTGGLTKLEIQEKFSQVGEEIDPHRLGHLLVRGEVEAYICSGIDKGKKGTYALLDERVPPTPELTKEESLARLARNYFRSHSPASLADFTWWSGLSTTEARQAIALISSEMVSDKFAPEKLYVHDTCPMKVPKSKAVHLLPSFDEFLISYKDRTAALGLEHQPKAFTKNGIFHPVILSEGKIVGSWSRVIKKGKVTIDTSLFDPCFTVEPKDLGAAADKYKAFL